MFTMTSIDLFADRLNSAALHPNFIALRDSAHHTGARNLINALYSRMGDPNGNFDTDFQGPGFHARIFELACFGYLESAGATLDRTNEQPDFLGKIGGVDFALESTTANVSDGTERDISVLKIGTADDASVDEDECSKRLHRRLLSKVCKNYHLRPHCQDRPIVLAIAPFFAAGSVFNADQALISPLLGCVQQGAPSFDLQPVFSMPEAQHISAVLYCNQFTVPKFWRLSGAFASDSDLSGSRAGLFFGLADNEELCLNEYEYRLDDPSVPPETWWQGVTVIHNPRAVVPIKPQILPCSSTIELVEGKISRQIHGFHPINSFMTVKVT